ncbi:MAG TPA: succinate dehydrogenase assembly factor 2 [Caulobacteraceae bacterium]|nr:succinate dehydrogenase assembly factor 2 [Caulobacteraceae bacterium]
MPDARLEKLRYRAWRRGFAEADLLLGGFADAHLATMTTSDLDAFERLLDQPDPDLWDWIVGGIRAPAAVEGALLDRLRAFKAEELAASLRR